MGLTGHVKCPLKRLTVESGGVSTSYTEGLLSMGSGGLTAPRDMVRVFILSVATVLFRFRYSCMNTFVFYTNALYMTQVLNNWDLMIVIFKKLEFLD